MGIKNPKIFVMERLYLQYCKTVEQREKRSVLSQLLGKGYASTLS